MIISVILDMLHYSIYFFEISIYSSTSGNTLPLFILAFISLISSNPSGVKCFLLLINSAAWHQSLKSKDLTPNILCLLTKGMIFSRLSENFATFKVKTLARLLLPFTAPHSKYSLIPSNNSVSLAC